MVLRICRPRQMWVDSLLPRSRPHHHSRGDEADADSCQPAHRLALTQLVAELHAAKAAQRN